ncbi:type VI secretion system baseplate subunit TssE [Martelella sp. AMO21009]
MRGDRDTDIRDSIDRRSAGSLFERLVLDEENMAIERTDDAASATVRSIKRHLIRLLNARSGASQSAPGLGLADFNESSIESNDLTRHIAASIRDCINSFEPRVEVKVVECMHDPDRPLDLKFRIQALVPAKSRQELVEIDLLMRDGHATQII